MSRVHSKRTKRVITIFQNPTGAGADYLYSTRGYTIVLKFLLGAPRRTPVHPGWGSEVGCRNGSSFYESWFSRVEGQVMQRVFHERDTEL